MKVNLSIKTPKWSLPLLDPAALKGAKGGRAGGKSHFFAEYIIEAHVINPNSSTVCIREIQKSIKYSSKRLIEEKIKSMKVAHLFKIMNDEIKSISGSGVIIFQGMQDHTAESIKSLEGFDRAFVEEANNLSVRSVELLVPTIRKENSEILAIWNPRYPDSPIELLFKDTPGSVLVSVNYVDNPLCPKKAIKEAEQLRERDYGKYKHIYLGEYETRSEARVFHNYSVKEFVREDFWAGAYFGLDFGFAVDPTACVECYAYDNDLYIYRSAGKVGLELDKTPAFLIDHFDDIASYTMRADSSRPETISYLRHHGLPKVIRVKKTKIEDGIEHLKSFNNIYIHPDCVAVADEFMKLSYKTDRYTGDILPVIIDKNNHYIDAIRYAVRPMITRAGGSISLSTLNKSRRY